MIVIVVLSTKGGVGKTTLSANLGALFADLGLETLIVDTDTQPALSKYFPLNYLAPNGLVEFLLDDNILDNGVQEVISNTIYPKLDIVVSNNLSSQIQNEVNIHPAKALLLQKKLQHPEISERYKVVIIDTQGAIGPIQESASFAADVIISPVVTEALSAREFLSGTQEMIKNRINVGSWFGMEAPAVYALLYAMDRTRDSRSIAEDLQHCFAEGEGSGINLMQTIVPSAKAYKEATSRRIPVHCHEVEHQGKSVSAYSVMHSLVYELFPMLQQENIRASCFDCGKDILTPITDAPDLSVPEEMMYEAGELL